MLQVRDQVLDRLFHAVEIGEGRVSADYLILKYATESRVVVGVDDLRFANRCEQAFGRTGIGHRVLFAEFQVVVEAHDLFACGLVPGLVALKNRHSQHLCTVLLRMGALPT